MKWYLVLTCLLIASGLKAQHRTGLTASTISHEEEIYVKNFRLDASEHKLVPVSLNQLPMAVHRQVREKAEKLSEITTYKVVKGIDLKKIYYLAVIREKNQKIKIYYDKEGKIAKSVTLFD